jgi:hypothetical protein
VTASTEILVVAPGALPDYDDLPEIPGLGVKHSWGLLHPSLGTLSLLSDGATAAAARNVRTGERVALSLSYAEFDPPLFGRPAIEHVVLETGRNTYEDVISAFNPQSASQLDGLLHIRAREHGFYGGITDLDEAREVLGMHHWGTAGIAGRGVLVDVARHRAGRGLAWDAFAGDTVEPEELQEVLTAQGTVLEPGDVLLVRIGWLTEFRRRTAAGEVDPARVGERFSGIASHDAAVRFLWNSRLAAIGSDNPAVESAPGDVRNGSLHRKLIPGLGMALAELLDLETLSRRCAELERWEFLLTSAPLPLPGGASSTANLLAIL